MEIKDLLRETGGEVRDRVREELPVNKPDEQAEQMWAEALTGNDEYNAAVVGEEGTYRKEESPDYAFLVDPLDGTSGAVNGEFPWISTAVTVLEDIDVNGDRIEGTPAVPISDRLTGTEQNSHPGTERPLSTEKYASRM